MSNIVSLLPISKEISFNDINLILEWRNNVVTRNNSLVERVIGRKEHFEFMNKKLSDKDCRMFFIVFENKKVGIIRLDFKSKSGFWLVNINVDPFERGKGFGKKALVLLVDLFKGERLVAVIKNSNVVSVSLFLSVGFVKFDVNDVFCCYERFC